MRRRTWLLAALLASWTILSLRLLHGGHIHPEAEAFIPHYLSGQPFWGIIFDPWHTDWGNYQARELSYVFDWLDCQVMARCVVWGRPNFLSLTHFGLTMAVAVLLARFAWNDLKLPDGIGLGVAALWLTSPAAVLGGSFYRSAKILAGTALCLMAIFAWRWLKPHGPARPNRGALVGFTVSAACAGLADRQGYFLVLFVAAWFGLRAALERDRASVWATVAAASVVAGLWIYTTVLAPHWVHMATGRAPDMGFMRLPWAELWGAEAKIYLGFAPHVGLAAVGMAWGNLPWVLVAAVALGGAWWLATPAEGEARGARRMALALWWLLPAVAIGVMYCLMALRQRSVVTLPDFQRIYFPIPTMILGLVLGAIALRAALDRRWFEPRVALAGLWLLVASNLGSLTEHKLVYAAGTQRINIEQADAQRARLQRGAVSTDVAGTTNPAVVALRSAADEIERRQR